MKNVLHSTTALGVSIALAMPGPIVAQTQLPDCVAAQADSVFPCVLNGETVESAEGLALLQDALNDAAAEEAEAQAAEEAAAAEQAAAEAQAAEEAAAAEQAAAEAQAAEEAAAAEQAAAEAQAAEEAAAAEQAEAAEEPVTDNSTAGSETTQEAASEDTAAADAQATEDAEAAQKAAEQEAQRAERKAARKAERKAARQEERRAERRAARKAEREAIAAAAAEVASGEAQSNVVTEEVTEDEVRSSDEEFETAVTGEGAAAAPATSEASPAKDDGLSKLEKALLLGLGAAVVGSVLKNGDTVVSNSGDRIVVEDPDGALRVLKDEDALIRRPGDEVRTETFSDGSSRSFVTRPDGSRVVTIRGRDGSVLRRINIDPQGNEYVLFDDLVEEEAVIVSELPPVETRSAVVSDADEVALRAALQAELAASRDRTFSLRQVREIREVRSLVPELELDAVQFETGSAAIRPEQARALARIGTTLRDLVEEDPSTVILVEGHTDAVGSATYNLALSDRRAETVALALTEYFRVPAENMVTQGYGESALKVITDAAEPANRRAVVRNITGLLR